MAPSREFPYQDGDVTVLGPEIFASDDGQDICWKGKTYIPQKSAEEPAQTPDSMTVRFLRLPHTKGAWAEPRLKLTREQLLEAVDRIHALHHDWEADPGHCAHCQDGTGTPLPWPCPTIQALDGEEQP